MAEVVSGKDMTVIVLDNRETEALTESLRIFFNKIRGTNLPWVLDELTNALLGMKGECDEYN